MDFMNSKEQSNGRRKETASPESMQAAPKPSASRPPPPTETSENDDQLAAGDGPVDAVFTQFKSAIAMSAPGSLSIDTAASTPSSASALHRHKVSMTPLAFTTSPSGAKPGGSNHQMNYSKPSSPTKSTSPTLSSASTDSSVASSGVKLMVSNMILRKRESIAFFIDLLSPDSLNLRQTQYTAGNDDEDLMSPRSAASPRSPSKKMPDLIHEEEEDESGSSPVKGRPMMMPNNAHTSSAQQPLQPPILAPAPLTNAKAHTSTTVDTSIKEKTSAGSGKEKPVVEVTNKPGQPITFPKLRSHSLRPAAKELQSILESRMTSATLKRARILQSRSQKLLSYAQSVKVKLLIHDSRQRLETLRMQARQEYNASNAQLNRQVTLRQVREKFGSRVEHAKRIMLIQKMKKFVELRRALSENFLDLLRLNEDLDKEQDAGIAGRNRKEIMETLGLAVSLDEKDEEYEEMEEADRFPIPDSPEEKAKKFKDFSSDFLFASSPGPRESMVDRIKRTKSLPDLVLKESSYDATIQELLELLPPVTRFTLRELEMDEILSNMQLRHDIVFDPDLQFKASDADDEEALEKSRAYWSELEQEVQEGHLYRICLLLSEVRAIMIELVPNGMEIKDEILSHIDTHLISQQIEHGVMDPTVLIEYIAGIMKTNCAPIRDKIVDRMVAECQQGKIVKCLESCFEVLELMKLDYANHQLTRLRPYIIEHSVNYEWKYFKNQVESKQVTLDSTIEWLKRNWEAYKVRVTGSPNPAYDLYPEAFVEIVGQASKYADTDILPETLKMDIARLISFYNSWQDITILSTILVVFKQAAGPRCMADNIQEAKTSLWILLNDTDSTMSHISVQMASMAGKIRNHPFTAAETTALNTMTEKMLAPGSKLYELMQGRVRVHLVNGVAGQKIDEELLAKHGIQAVKTEIEELVAKMVPISELNRAVFGKFYAALLDDIKEGKEADSPTGRKVIFEED